MPPVTRTLDRHPASRATALTQVTIAVEREADLIAVRFVARGDLTRLLLPAPICAGRAEDLWKTTCFEVFVEELDGYREYNLSPSGQWAAYRFEGYRKGRSDIEGDPVGPISVRTSDDGLILEAAIRLPGRKASTVLGLSVVEQDINGDTSYWALAHADGDPDFHSAVAFDLILSEELSA